MSIPFIVVIVGAPNNGLSAPILSLTVVNDTAIDLDWVDTATAEDGFKIERSLNGSSWSQIATVGANVITYSDTGLSPSTLYYYRVRAYDSITDGAYSNVDSDTTSAVTFLLNDVYTTNDAAPLASPRSAEPGAGTQTSVQTAASMSIVSSELNIPSAGSWGGLGYTYNSFARTSGRRFVVKFVPKTVSGVSRGVIAWNASTGVSFSNVDAWSMIFQADGSNITVQLTDAAGSSYGVVATLTVDVEYDFMVDQRAAGYYFYLSSDSGTTWKLINVVNTGSTGTVYPALGNHSMIWRVRRTFVPDNLWTPTTIYNDSFNNRGNRPYVTRFGTNPVIDEANNPNETLEQYTPAPVRLSNGDIWVYVKGQSTIYAWKSTDNGETFALQNSNNPVISPTGTATWDRYFTLEPAAVFDAASTTIHVYFKGTDNISGAGNWAIGHATAPEATPTVFTKNGSNPLLTSASVQSALGMGSAPTDLSITAPIKIGSTFYWYFMYLDPSISRYNIAYGTSTSLSTTITPVANVILGINTEGTLALSPNVFKWSGSSEYVMLYSPGVAQPGRRVVRVATSTDGITWALKPNAVLLIDEAAGTWDALECYTPAMLKETAEPYLAPLQVGGKYLLYYSGLKSGGIANTGLAHLDDFGAETVEANFPVTTLGTSDGDADTDALGGTGITLTDRNGTWEMVRNALATYGNVPSGVANGAWVATHDSGEADGVFVFDNIVNGSSACGMVLRYSDNDNFWVVGINTATGRLFILERNAGVETIRASSGVLFSGNISYRITVMVEGSTITAVVNGTVSMITYASATLNQTETEHGVWGLSRGDRIDSLVQYNRLETGVPN